MAFVTSPAPGEGARWNVSTRSIIIHVNSLVQVSFQMRFIEGNDKCGKTCKLKIEIKFSVVEKLTQELYEGLSVL